MVKARMGRYRAVCSVCGAPRRGIGAHVLSTFGRSLAFGVTVGVATLIGFTAYQEATEPDPGIRQCRALEDGDNPTYRKGHDQITKQEYIRLRDTFKGSDDRAIRSAGISFADSVWAFARARPGDNPETYFGPLRLAYTDLTTACANHGYEIPPFENL